MKMYIIKCRHNGKVLLSTPNKAMALHRFMRLVNKDKFKLVIVERSK